MERTTISLPSELHKQLRIIAAERGISMASFIREAIREKTEKRRPELRFLGAGASGYKHTARDSADLDFEPASWR